MRFILVLTLIGLGTGCAEKSSRGGSTSKPVESVAVLPFTGKWNKPGIASDNWPERVRLLLEEIIPDAVSSDLVEQNPTPTLKVIPASVSREKKLAGLSAMEAGKALGVDAIVTGQVSGDGMLTVQLINVGTGSVLWTKSYQLFFGFSDKFGGFRISIDDEHRQDITRNVLVKVTGKELPEPKKE